MNQLLREIKELEKTSVKHIVDNKINEFKLLKKASNDFLFPELCFCILAANFNAEKSLKIQNNLQNKFYTLSEIELANKLKEFGHRFPNVRAKYIVEVENII